MGDALREAMEWGRERETDAGFRALCATSADRPYDGEREASRTAKAQGKEGAMCEGQRGSRWAVSRDGGGRTAYAPLVLRNMEEICEVMGVGRKTVREWVERGAPIAVEGLGGRTRYSAEAAALQDWRIQRHPVRQDASLSSAED